MTIATLVLWVGPAFTACLLLRNALDRTVQHINTHGVEHHIGWNFSHGTRRSYDGADVGQTIRVLATNNYEVFTFDSVITFDAQGELKFFV